MKYNLTFNLCSRVVDDRDDLCTVEALLSLEGGDALNGGGLSEGEGVLSVEGGGVLNGGGLSGGEGVLSVKGAGALDGAGLYGGVRMMCLEEGDGLSGGDVLRVEGRKVDLVGSAMRTVANTLNSAGPDDILVDSVRHRKCAMIG